MPADLRDPEEGNTICLVAYRIGSLLFKEERLMCGNPYEQVFRTLWDGPVAASPDPPVVGRPAQEVAHPVLVSALSPNLRLPH